MDIQSKLNKVEMSPGKPLSVKIGVGVGPCRVLFVGGQFKRCEYLIVGEAMRQACESETHATEGGQTIISQPVYDLVKKFYEVEEALGDDSHGHDSSSDMKFYRITKIVGERVAIKSDAYLMRTLFSQEKLREKLPILKTFVPAAISIYLDIEKETWSKEIRLLTVMFLNLKVDLSQTKNEEGMKRIQDIVHVVQRCVYRTKGSLNKFLMDDKGSVMLICWGLPPLSSPDDHIRCVLTALDLTKELQKYNCGAYMGIATGSCFTGVCGTVGGRREYSLLGEMVNLSARHMQKAIYHAIDMKKENKKNVDYLTLVCEKTRDLIQNKIACDYVTQGELKGFTNIFYFYEPKTELKPKIESPSYFLPDIKTHRNNVLLGLPNPKEKQTLDAMLKSSLYMVGRKDYLDECLITLSNVYKKECREFILIRGVTGSGKSLFVRRVMYDFIDSNRELKNKLNNRFPFIFVSYQLPTTAYDPMNGWCKILREIYFHLKSNITGKRPTKFKLGSENVVINCDQIGEILLNSDCVSYVKYIEEILNVSFSDHYEFPEDSVFSRFFQIKEIPKRDSFYESRKFDKIEKTLCKFFVQLIKAYREGFIADFPLIFILEDIHVVDEVSLEMIKALTVPLGNCDGNLSKGVCVIATYQDQINAIVRNPFDRISKYGDLFLNEKTYVMDNITDIVLAHDLIRHSIQGKVNVSQISEKLIHIVLTKSLKGNPLFIIDIIHSLLDSGYVKHPQQELQPSDELLEIYELNDWSNFSIPIRMEKLLGNIIDSLSTKEIILLKYASVIGNLFDIDKLNELNPFNSVTFDDLMQNLNHLEHYGIIEILYDIKPKNMVCKFNIPFFREVLFQRMLIEQRSDIHLNIARKMQYNKFSYMPHKQEVALLRNHLKITEKTILKHMEDKDDEIKDSVALDSTNSGSSLNINNIKIILVKDICERLKLIDLRMESEEIELSKRSLPIIKSGYIHKKSDKYISWEERYIVITNTKFFYWYHKEDYTNNKMPLGSFELKSLYSVEMLRDKLKGDRTNLFHIQVSSWYKRDKQNGSREYYFSCPTRDELYTWVITLNFLRVKAMYDEFSCNFGLINLPLTHEIKRKNNRKIKTKFNGNLRKIGRNGATSNTFYSAIARKSFATNKSLQSKSIIEKESSILMRRLSSVNPNSTDVYSDERDNSDKINKIKELMTNSFHYGFASFFGFMQDIIFGVDNVGLSDDRMITIPKHLEMFKQVPVSKSLNTQDKDNKSSFKASQVGVSNNQNDIEERSDEDSDSENSKKNAENNISFQHPSASDDSRNQQNQNTNNQVKLNFTIKTAHPGTTSSVEPSRVIENPIGKKLKNLKIDNNDDQMEDLINSLSQGQNSKLSDDDSRENHKENNILREINEKKNMNLNVNSRIFLKK